MWKRISIGHKLALIWLTSAFIQFWIGHNLAGGINLLTSMICVYFGEADASLHCEDRR